MRYCLLKCKY